MFNYHVRKIQSLVPIRNEFTFYFIPFASGLTVLTSTLRSSKRALPSVSKNNIFYALLISHLQAATSSQPIFLYFTFLLREGEEYKVRNLVFICLITSCLTEWCNLVRCEVFVPWYNLHSERTKITSLLHFGLLLGIPHESQQYSICTQLTLLPSF
jgi:hypothetical protein